MLKICLDCVTKSDFIDFKVRDLAAVSLDKPVRVFVNENTDVALNLRQEFIRIRANREADREAIVAGKELQVTHSKKKDEYL